MKPIPILYSTESATRAHSIMLTPLVDNYGLQRIIYKGMACAIEEKFSFRYDIKEFLCGEEYLRF